MASNGETLTTTTTKLTRSFIFAAKKLALPILQTTTTTTTISSSHITNLVSKLDKIRATISDAEKLHVTDLSVKFWISDLRDLESMAVDIIEEFESSCRYTQLCLDIVTSTESFVDANSFPHPPDLTCLERKIDLLKERCNEIAVDRRQLRLREGDGARRGEASSRPPSSSFSDGELFGREEELKDVVEFLVCETNSDSVSVLPVVGMAGVGKTAFVQHVYNHWEVKDCFQTRIWVCVSESFDVIKITRAIAESITEEACGIIELDPLQKKVGKLLAEKRFLLVLDDLWDFSSEHWDALQKPLRFGADGSKIILTSASVSVAKLVGTRRLCSLGYLTDDNCALICKSYALKGRDVDVNDDFSAAYHHTIAKLKGLPLAAKALGVLMRAAFVDDCIVKYLPDDLYDQVVELIVPALRRSYDRLPPYLKRCFLYCSLFPQGYIFEKDQLVRLWMAQGFIVCDKGSQLQYVASIGRKYFDELVGLLFFQVSPFYDVSEEMYVMHDLYHELAYSISGQEFVRLEGYKLKHMHYLARHSSLTPSKEDADKTIQFDPFEGQSLRSFLFIGRLEYKQDGFPISSFSQKIELMFNVNIADNLFIWLECLRALDLRNTDIAKLPDSVGSLKHLHYLCLENTKIVRLPDSICSLYKLQTLDLKHCYHLEELPQGTRHLLSLQHLELPSSEHSNLQLPSGIGKLTCLEQLPIFYVGSLEMNCKISELKSLVNLQGEMQISGLANVADENDAEVASLKNKARLRKLMLQWFTKGWPNGYGSELVGNAELVLTVLQPNHNLEELHIRHYCGLKFPEWIGSPKFSRLVTLKLQECFECVELPTLGQLPALRHLAIQMMNKVQSIGRKFRGEGDENSKAFPKLDSLEFVHMNDWEEWSGVEDGDFPCLQRLIIISCPKLKIVPQQNALKNCGLIVANNYMPLTFPQYST